MFCTNCGASLPGGGRFCHACGRPLAGAAAAAPARAPVPVPVRGPGGQLPSCVRAALVLEEGEVIVSAWQAYAPGLLRSLHEDEVRPASENGYLLASDRSVQFLVPVNGAGTAFRAIRRLRYEDLTAVEAGGLTGNTLVLRAGEGVERYTSLRELDLTLRRGTEVRARDVQAVVLALVRIRRGPRPADDGP